MAEVVQGGTDERISAQLRAPDRAQGAWDPKRDPRKERADDDAADQQFPEQVGVGGADITRWREIVRQAPGGLKRHSAGDQASDGLRRNQILADCLPILASHQSPADFRGGVSGLTGLDQVNAYPCNPKMCLKLRQLP